MHSEGIGTQRAAGDGHVTNLIPIDAHVLVIDESKADPGGLAGSDDGLVDPDGGGHGAVLSKRGVDYADGRLNVGRRVAVTVPLLWTEGMDARACSGFVRRLRPGPRRTRVSAMPVAHPAGRNNDLHRGEPRNKIHCARI